MTSPMIRSGSFPPQEQRVEETCAPPSGPTSWGRALPVIAALAETAGWVHDWGKASVGFQAKLQSPTTTVPDPVRHEWWSQALWRAWRDDPIAPWTTLWVRARADVQKQQHGPLSENWWRLNEAADAVALIVATHHRLPDDPTSKGTARPGKRPAAFGDLAFKKQEHKTYYRNPTGTTRFPITGDQRLSSKKRTASPDPLECHPNAAQALVPLSRHIEEAWGRLTEAICAHDKERAPLFWHAAAVVARACMILADHEQSAVDPDLKTPPEPASTVWANTRAAAVNTYSFSHIRRPLHQPLAWHLERVGSRSRVVAEQWATSKWPGLPPETCDQIRGCVGLIATKQEAGQSDSRYKWQDTAASFLAASADDRVPTLVLNAAGTGTGKTRMNLRALAALHTPERGSFRVSSCLNMRTLTLQTLEAYRTQAVDGTYILEPYTVGVIGDQATRALHEATTSGGQKTTEAATADGFSNDQEDEDGNILDAELVPLVVPRPAEPGHPDGSSADEPSLAWLDHTLKRHVGLADVMRAPIAVSTIDYLIQAGDLSAMGGHAAALVRVSTSDLILDEIDGYDPTALGAVARLLSMAALFGRNVVVSSATCDAESLALLAAAWRHGLAARKALCMDDASADHVGRVVLLDDHVAVRPAVSTWIDLTPITQSEAWESDESTVWVRPTEGLRQDVREVYQSFVASRPQPSAPIHLAQLWSMAGASERTSRSWIDEVRKAAAHLDAAARQQQQAGSIQMGLIRVAHVPTAAAVAAVIARDGLTPATYGGAPVRVCCYHSQTTTVRRHLTERALDQLLTRPAGPNGYDTWMKQIRAVAEEHGWADEVSGQPLTIVVVATPVEEVGRDHDFDWAVIEPSGVGSIIQTAGRVNRHRRCPVTHQNVAILEYNKAAWKAAWTHSNAVDQVVFRQPGLDYVEEDGHSSFFQTQAQKIPPLTVPPAVREVGSLSDFLAWPGARTPLPLSAAWRFDRRPDHFLVHPLAHCEEAALRKWYRPLWSVFSVAGQMSADDLVDEGWSLWWRTSLYRWFRLRDENKSCAFVVAEHEEETSAHVPATTGTGNIPLQVCPALHGQWLLSGAAKPVVQIIEKMKNQDPHGSLRDSLMTGQLPHVRSSSDVAHMAWSPQVGVFCFDGDDSILVVPPNNASD